MSIGKSKITRVAFLLATGLMWVGLLSDFGAGKEKAKAANLPKDIGKWCRWKSGLEKRFKYPIDQSDGGCDCEPK